MKKLMAVFLSWSILAFILTLGAPKHHLLPLRAPANIESRSQVVLIQHVSDSFYSKVDQESKEIIKIIGRELNHNEQTKLEKLRKKAFEFIKEQNPILHVKEIFKKHGIGAAITASATEFTSIILIPSIIMPLGWHELAAISIGSPSFMATVPAYVWLKKVYDKRRLSKEYDIPSISQMDRLRKEILGYAVESHIIQTTIEKLEENKKTSSLIDEMKFNVTKSRFTGLLNHKWHKSIGSPLNKFLGRPLRDSIDIAELEKIAKEHLGDEHLEVINKLSHGDLALYSYVLVTEIGKKPEAFDALEVLLSERVLQGPSLHKDFKRMRELILKVNEVRKFEYLVNENFQVTLGQLRRSPLFSGRTSDALVRDKAQQLMTQWRLETKKSLELFLWELNRAEYHALYSYKTGETIDLHQAGQSIEDLNNKVKTVQEMIASVDRALQNSTSLQGFNLVMGKHIQKLVELRNREPVVATKLNMACDALMGRLMRLTRR